MKSGAVGRWVIKSRENGLVEPRKIVPVSDRGIALREWIVMYYDR